MQDPPEEKQTNTEKAEHKVNQTRNESTNTGSWAGSEEVVVDAIRYAPDLIEGCIHIVQETGKSISESLQNIELSEIEFPDINIDL